MKTKTIDEWKKQLSPLAFQVTRQNGTEPAFSGEYYQHDIPGRYSCVCCGTPLFDSSAKFDAGCGWPSYFKAINPDDIVELKDTRYGMVRTEIRCRHCDAHLGHVFPDGPPPTGLRYCLNSVALNFEAVKA